VHHGLPQHRPAGLDASRRGLPGGRTARDPGDENFLFKASDASWLTEQIPAGVPHQLAPYVTDGPQPYRTPDGSLLMPWSTYEKNVAGDDDTVSGGYVQTYAVSGSGDLAGRGTNDGPWSARTAATACCSTPSTVG
jgi:hypothetical protein